MTPVLPAGLVQIEDLFRRIISLAVGFAFIALVLTLVYGGIKFLTSGGDPKAIKPAADTITWALLGMLFLVIAWLVLQLIEAFTGVKVTNFNIGALCANPDLAICLP